MAGDHARESVVVGLNLNQLISLLRQFSEYLLMESARAKPNAHVVLWYSDLDQRLVGHARQVGLKGGLHGSAGRCFQRNHQRGTPSLVQRLNSGQESVGGTKAVASRPEGGGVHDDLTEVGVDFGCSGRIQSTSLTWSMPARMARSR